MSEFPIYEVIWLDALGADGWLSIDEILKITCDHHSQVGYLINENEQEITLCMSYDEDLQAMGAYTVIPKVMIKSIRRIDVERLVIGTMEVESNPHPPHV